MSTRSEALRAARGSGPLPRALWAFTCFSMVEVVAWVAVILYAYEEGGVGLAGAIAVLQLLPAAVLAPALGALGDRLPRSRALLWSHASVLASAALTSTALVLELPIAVVVVASALITITISVVRPIHFAALPQLSPGPRDLVSANALSSGAEGLSLFLGPLIAGFGVQRLGAAPVLVGCTIAAAAAVLLCRGLPTTSRAAPTERPDEDQGWRAALAGVAMLRRTQGAVVLLLIFTTRFVIGGSIDVLGVAYADEVLGLGESAAGLIIGAVGIGGLLGGFAAAPVAMRPRLTSVVLAGGIGQGLAVAAVVAIGVLAPVVGLLALAGFAGAAMMVAGRTLLQRAADDAVLARVFAAQEATSLLGLSLGAAVAPILTERLAADTAFLVLGGGALLCTLAGAGSMRALDQVADVRAEEAALLRRVPFFSVLAPFELEQLARAATWLEVEAGTDITVQGEPGRHFYVVSSGELAVTVDGSLRPHVLGPGDSFGEIALLRQVPRTATITASTEVRLLGLDADAFLAVVTGSPDGHAVAAEVTAAHLLRDQTTDATTDQGIPR